MERAALGAAPPAGVSTATDRYANLEVNYLLQRIEHFDGVVVLTTNFQQSIDEAFKRRLTFMIEFPFPDAGIREDLWRSMFPPEAPLDEEVDLPWLAEEYELAGGHIKNVALRAAYAAAERGGPIDMEGIVEAVQREMAATGRLHRG